MIIEEIVKLPYTTRPQMVKNLFEVFNPVPSQRYIEQKQQQLRLFGSELYGQLDYSLGPNLVSRVSTFLGKPVTNDIEKLALSLNEDIAILHNGILSAICFCFPSSWIPATALGKTLEQIHAPVADGAHLRTVSNKLTSTISDPNLGSFRRYVWTITRNPSLSNHPVINSYYLNEEVNLNTLYFRIETQTTLPLPDGNTAVFFVDVNVLPLKDVWSGYKDIIKASMNSMTENVLEYKNLTDIKKYLNSID
jgi:hypothetical protein